MNNYIQLQTERGILAISRLYSTVEQARADGYTYAFSIRQPITADVYDIARDILHHNFVLVVTK